MPEVRAFRILINGDVQGIGFRPWIAREARSLGLRGWVKNTLDGVEVWIEGDERFLTEFVTRLGGTKVTLIAEIPTGCEGFDIRSSDANTTFRARVPLDRAMCPACLRELRDRHNRRYGYPFTTCGICGPRYTILEQLPYDRERLAMRHFPMCVDCQREYADPADRRYHIEGFVCPACGPTTSYRSSYSNSLIHGERAISEAIRSLQEGAIVAIQGMGGFQLLVRADLPAAVKELRKRKRRPHKPFAVMVPDIVWLTTHLSVNPAEIALLTSAHNPIVLLRGRTTESICKEVSPLIDMLGILLATTPLHQRILDALRIPLIATSGNASDEPIEIEPQAAMQGLREIADGFLIHSRPILRRADDSVAMHTEAGPVILRLGRGYGPLPLPALERNSSIPPMLALGGHKKVALAWWTGFQANLGLHIGDMDHPSSRDVFLATVADIQQLYQFVPRVVVCDEHPDYFTTRWAATRDATVVRVQHHHAHAAAVLAEHDRFEAETLAIIWDGTGYGPDGTLWGGECLQVVGSAYRRVARLKPFPLLGGEKAIREPKRIAFVLLAESLGIDRVTTDRHWLNRLGITDSEAIWFAQMLQQQTQVVWTSSVGRLFDGIASLLLGIGEIAYEGEAAIRLEAAAGKVSRSLPRIDTVTRSFGEVGAPLLEGDWSSLVASVVEAWDNDDVVPEIAAGFHQQMCAWAIDLTEHFPRLPVVLGGGCFQNCLLRDSITSKLGHRGREVLASSRVPPGDGGLAVGQLAVAMARYRTVSERG